MSNMSPSTALFFFAKRVVHGSPYLVGHVGKRTHDLLTRQEAVAYWVAKQRNTSPSSLGKGKALYKYCAQYQHMLGVVVRIYVGVSEVPSGVEYLRARVASSERVFVQKPTT